MKKKISNSKGVMQKSASKNVNYVKRSIGQIHTAV